MQCLQGFMRRGHAVGVALGGLVLSGTAAEVAGTGCGHPLFWGPRYSVGNGQSVAIGDLDGADGSDIVVTDHDGVSVLINQGDGTMSHAVKYTAGPDPQSLAVGDFDGANGLDLAVADADGIWVLLNQGDGTFADAVLRDVGAATSVAVGDFDQSGGADLAVTIAGVVHVLLNDGNGGFESAVAYDVGGNPISVAIGDFDGADGPDLAVTNESDIILLMNNGDGTFAEPLSISVEGVPWFIAAGDLDGTNGPDLAVVATSSVLLFLNEGDGTFADPASYADEASFVWNRKLAIGHLDDDGDLDLAVSRFYFSFSGSGSLPIVTLSNNGDGTFADPVPYDVGHFPVSVAIGDLDGVEGPDIAVANSGGASFQSPFPGRGDVLVMTNNGDGTFWNGVYDVEGAVAIGDLDGVNGPDVVVEGVHVLLNNDDGTLAPAVSYDAEGARVAIADLDDDGDLDVVTSFVNVLLNNGDGTLATPVPYAVGDDSCVAVGDLDGTNGPDLAVTYKDGVSVLFNSGDGTFLPPEFHVVSAGGSSRAVAIADLDGINGLDLAVACDEHPGSSVSALMNNGGRTFAPPVSYTVHPGGWTNDLVIGDLDEDGHPELVQLVGWCDGICCGTQSAVLSNNGDGTFGAPVSIPGGNGAVAIGDLDGVNGPDLVQVSGSSPGCEGGSGGPGYLAVQLNNGDGSFGEALVYDRGGGGFSVAIDDLDVNGALDVVTSGVSVLLNACRMCSADLDGSGSVDFADILTIIAAWGTCPPVCPEDLDGSGAVDFADILIVLASWGDCA
jgi:hypothetical protein